jgi:predicted kinase
LSLGFEVSICAPRVVKNTLVIVRGLPGSGKSTLARDFKADESLLIEADMYWYRNPERTYNFEMEHLSRAHRWCLQTAEAFLVQDRDVVVANTNLTFADAKPYVDFAKRLGTTNIVVYSTLKEVNYGSIHNVPAEVMERMYNKMESHDSFMEKLRAYQPH